MPIDSQVIRHDQDFFVLQGQYDTDEDDHTEEVYCAVKRKAEKRFKRNKKDYKILSEHIGFIPLVLVSPSDEELISGGSEERRRFMDLVISQYDHAYINELQRYNKALLQRNAILKQEDEPDINLLQIWEEVMAEAGEIIYKKRSQFIKDFIPIWDLIILE